MNLSKGIVPLNTSKNHNNQKSETDPEHDQYYRLIPAEESRTYEYGTINFFDFLRYYWIKRHVFYWSVGILLAVGLFFAFFSPVEYESQTSIVPEYELQDRVNEIIESYGLLLGLTGSIRENRTPSYLLELYPYMIRSVSFQQDLMARPFKYDKRDTTITMFDYFTRFHRPSLTQRLYRYTLGLPATIGSISNTPSGDDSPAAISGADSIEHMSPVPDSEFPVLNLDPRESSVINALRSRITANYMRGIGIVHIQTKMPEPELAATLAQLTLDVLHEKALEYKTGKARIYMQFLEAQLEQAEAEMEEAREALIQFRNSDNESFSKRLELQSNYETILSRYNSLSEQINRIQSDIQEQLPVFRILDDITLPEQRSEPNRRQIIIFSLLVGILLAACWITVAFFVSRLKE